MVLQMVVVVQKNMKLTHFLTLNNFCFLQVCPTLGVSLLLAYLWQLLALDMAQKVYCCI